MKAESIADIRLIGRALIGGWLDSDPQKKAAAIDSILDVIQSCPDDEMRVKAFEAMVKADLADIRRGELELKKQVADDERRIRLLGILGSLPSGAVAKIASDHQANSDE